MIITKRRLHNLLYRRLYLVLAVFPFAAGFLMFYKTPRFSVCYLMNLTGLPCPFCGISRSFSFLTHLDFAGALEHNLLILFFAPLFCAVAVCQLLPAGLKRKLFFYLVKYRGLFNLTFYMCAGLVLLYGVVRILDAQYHFLGLYNPRPAMNVTDLFKALIMK